ncbi:unnamed protein product [Amoebophrya sp. A25]|nr:unnamed protein product [Amoebophrya sp. A25]|eukprot:GSA25T00014866001.1
MVLWSLDATMLARRKQARSPSRYYKYNFCRLPECQLATGTH